MAIYTANRGYASRRGGQFIEIEGLDEIIRSLGMGINTMHKIIREMMRGEVGQAMLAYMLPQVPIGRRFGSPGRGTMVSRTRLWDFGERGGVEIGYRGEMVQNPGVQGARYQLGTWIESGTRRHTIVPKNAKMLHWEDSTGHHFASKVEVSGIRGRYIALQTLQANEWRVLLAFQERLDRAFPPQGSV
jgi:hypothetical protein